MFSQAKSCILHLNFYMSNLMLHFVFGTSDMALHVSLGSPLSYGKKIK